MIVVVAALLGALYGAWVARRRKGRPLDQAQYAAVYGLIFALAAVFFSVILVRMG